MTTEPLTDDMVKQVASAAGTAAIAGFIAQHPEFASKQKVEMPAPLKWASGVIASLFVMGASGLAFWLVGTVNDMQVTLARVDERTTNQSEQGNKQLDDLQKRMSALEAIMSNQQQERVKP